MASIFSPSEHVTASSSLFLLDDMNCLDLSADLMFYQWIFQTTILRYLGIILALPGLGYSTLPVSPSLTPPPPSPYMLKTTKGSWAPAFTELMFRPFSFFISFLSFLSSLYSSLKFSALLALRVILHCIGAGFMSWYCSAGRCFSSQLYV